MLLWGWPPQLPASGGAICCSAGQRTEAVESSLSPAPAPTHLTASALHPAPCREPLLPPTSLDQAALADLAAEGEEEPENSRLCSWKPLLGISSAGLAAFLVIALAALGLLALSVADRQPPLCRKSAALGVVAGGLKGSNNQSLELLVWSGMARHRSGGTTSAGAPCLALRCTMVQRCLCQARGETAAGRRTAPAGAQQRS